MNHAFCAQRRRTIRVLKSATPRKIKFLTKKGKLMNGKVTESIYSGKGAIIPLADVVFIQRREFGIQVVMKGTTYNSEQDDYNNSAYLDKEEAEKFIACWCRYRGELESDTLMNLQPDSIYPDEAKD